MCSIKIFYGTKHLAYRSWKFKVNSYCRAIGSGLSWGSQRFWHLLSQAGNTCFAIQSIVLSIPYRCLYNFAPTSENLVSAHVRSHSNCDNRCSWQEAFWFIALGVFELRVLRILAVKKETILVWSDWNLGVIIRNLLRW